jgi:hypothetical protein
MLDKRVLRRILGPKMDEIKETGENSRPRSLIICTFNRIPLG